MRELKLIRKLGLSPRSVGKPIIVQFAKIKVSGILHITLQGDMLAFVGISH